MKKVKGKALSLVLSLALVISSFSAIPASAATKTLDGSLNGDYDTEFYLVNGGEKEDLVYEEFGTAVSNNAGMKTPNHKVVNDVHIAAISHASGDRLVKWYDSADGTDNIDTDTKDEDIDLALRSSTVSGEEKLNILYKGTYTDDEDNEYTVKAQKEVTIRVYNVNETVVGDANDAGAHTSDNGVKGELDSSFAQKTVAYEKSKLDKAEDPTKTDSKDLVVLKATADPANKILVKWDELKTVADSDANDQYLSDKKDADGKTAAERDGVYYVLKSSSGNIGLNTAGVETDYSYKTDATCTQGTQSAGKTYTAEKVVAGDNLGIDLSTDGKLTVTNPTDPSKITKITYTVDGTDPANDTTDVITAATATDIASKLDAAAKDGKATIKVAAFDTDGKPVGTAVSTDVTIVTTVEILPAACPTLKQDGTDFGKFTVTSAVNGESASPKWTYKYTVDGGTETAVPADGVITLSTPKADADVTLVVTAYDNAGKAQGTAKAVVSVNKEEIPGTDLDYVTAQVKTNANTGSLTFTAEATPLTEDAAELEADETGAIHSSKDIKVKSSIDKQIKVSADLSSWSRLSKYSTSTYLYTSEVDKDTKDKAIKVNGYDVKFGSSTDAKVEVSEKASVNKISGKVASITVDSGNVQSIVLDDGCTPSIHVSDAKVGTVDFGGDHGTLDVDSNSASITEVKDAGDVTVKNGTVGNISSNAKVIVRAEDDEHSVSVGDITALNIEIDSDNSKVSVGTLKPTDDESEITLTGDFVTVKAIDFDNYGAELKIDDLVGTIPAPKNAAEDGATISTNNTGDKVTIDGDANINAIAIGDDSQMIFNGKLNVGSVDGSGTLVVGLGQMDISSDASGVTLKFSDPTIKVGDTAFTAVTDTVDVDSMEPYGCTLSKSEGSKTDTFKIASTEFVGLTFDKVSSEIAKGYSEKFQASAYAPGTAIPDGYKIQYTLDGDDDIFEMTNNDDGSVTVKVVDYDKDFAEENKATLKAELVDTDGDVDDDYVAGEVDLTAIAVPNATYKSDTGSTLSIGGGFTYQFAITSLDGNVPYFAVAGSSFKTTYVGNSGNTYYYKVTAVGKVGDAAGVYINHGATPSTVITITNPSDTAAVTVKAGGSYQFRVNGPSQPVFQVAGIGNIALTSKAGSNYYFKVNVPTNLAKGGHGVYNNGVLVAILTVA